MDARSAPSRGSHELAPGAVLGDKVQVLRRLAVGGMAELYLARTRGVGGFEKLVVVKRVLPHLAEEPEFIEMFFTEARLAATLDHPNIVHVTDIGGADEDPYFVMEYVHGEDLRALLRKTASRGPLPLECAVAIVIGAATGLHYVHERVGLDGRPLGLVHRDVSPSNILVTYEGGIKVADFGIVKAAARTQMTRAGMMKGKVGYMSPEQCRGDEIDRRSDVFGLGILLYETTTGHRLFYGDNDYAVLHHIVSGKYLPLSFDDAYPDPLKAIITRALQRDRDDRYPTAQAFLGDLEAFAQDAGLRLSPRVVSSCVRELFGDKPYPSTDVHGLVAWPGGPPGEPDATRAPVVHAVEIPRAGATSSVRRAWMTTAVVSSLAIAFGIVGFVHGLSSTPSSDTIEPDLAPSVEAQEVGLPVDERDVVTVLHPEDGSSDDTSDADVEATSGAPESSSVSSTKSRKKSVRRRMRRRPAQGERSGQVNDLFPPSHDKGR